MTEEVKEQRQQLQRYKLYKQQQDKLVMKQQLQLCHMVDDDKYLLYLIKQLLYSYDSYASIMTELPTILQRELYFNFPYHLLPTEYRNNHAFLCVWVKNVCEKFIVVNGNDVFQHSCHLRHGNIVAVSCSEWKESVEPTLPQDGNKQLLRLWCTKNNKYVWIVNWHVTNTHNIVMAEEDVTNDDGTRIIKTWYPTGNIQTIKHYTDTQHDYYTDMGWYSLSDSQHDQQQQLSYEITYGVDGITKEKRWYQNGNLALDFVYTSLLSRQYELMKVWTIHGDEVQISDRDKVYDLYNDANAHLNNK